MRFSEPDLGLSRDDYADLAANAVSIIHAAWAVNFRASLRSFVKDHLLGLHNLLLFALSSSHALSPHFTFCSSTASVILSRPNAPVQERISQSPLTASPLGYSRSKWIAEVICARAHASTRLKGRISVLRVGQLCGDTTHGVWNASEAWPLMLSSVRASGSLPDLPHESLSWLPVDVAAAAVAEASSIDDGADSNAEEEEVPVYHILNPHLKPTWSDLLIWLKRLYPGFSILPPNEWVENLENLRGKAEEHPARKLVGLWRDAYCGDNVKQEGKDKQELVFEMEKTKKAIAVMRDVRPVDEELFAKIWTWIEGKVYADGSVASS